MKTQSFLQVLFIFLGLFLFTTDALAQNDTTNDPWILRYSHDPGSTVFINRDTALTHGRHRVAIGNEFTLEDFEVFASSPNTGIRTQQGRLGLGHCNFWTGWIQNNPDRYPDWFCMGDLEFWTKHGVDDWNDPRPEVYSAKMVLTADGLLAIGVPQNEMKLI